jgi:hypothetical protein
MNELFHEMITRGPLIGAGGTLLFVGTLLWHLPRVYRGMFEVRASYATKLRAAGEEERAQKLEAETAILLRRVPFCGRVFVGIGILTLVASIFAQP